MSKKWVQAETEADEKLDVWVLVDEPETVGIAAVVDSVPVRALVLPNGQPWKRPRAMGFRPPEPR